MAPPPNGLSRLWSAYKLQTAPCEPRKCRRNCKANPYCLNQLGFERFEQRLATFEKGAAARDAKVLKRRPDDTPAGLRNSGNMCYMNSFLQVWFGDYELRRAVYSWTDDETDRPPVDESQLDVRLVMNELQTVFAHLEATPFTEAEPIGLVSSLQLGVEQQDAQEFGCLFLDCLQKELEALPEGAAIAQAIGSRYEGRLRHETVCATCNYRVSSETPFKELLLQVEKYSKLSASLNSYFAQEEIEWRCERCGATSALRRAVLTKAPPVLVLQLSRFVYDRSKQRKKKLSSSMTYPLRLNMTAFGDGCVEAAGDYRLSAVLVHQGTSASAGHYYTLMQEPSSGLWFKYNDEYVERIKSKVLDGTDDSDAPDSETSRGSNEAKGAYMLVYRNDAGANVDRPSLPAASVAALADMTADFEQQQFALRTVAEQGHMQLQDKADKLRALFDALQVKRQPAPRDADLADFVFMPTACLTHVLSEEIKASFGPDADSPSSAASDGETTEQPVELGRWALTAAVCAHGRVLGSHVAQGKWRVVAAAGLELLCQRYRLSFHQRFQLSELCGDCVDSSSDYAKFVVSIDKASVDIAAAASAFKAIKLANLRRNELQQYYYLGDESLKKWKSWAKNSKKAAVDRISELTVATVCKGDVLLPPPAKSAKLDESTSSVRATSPLAGDVRATFNDEVRCPHGGLSPSAKSYLVPEEIWLKLCEFLPPAVAFRATERFCRDCSNDECEKQSAHAAASVYKGELQGKLAGLLKAGLTRLVTDPNYRPTVAGRATPLVCRQFLQRLVAWTRSEVSAPPSRICNECLLCRHDGLQCIIADDTLADLPFVPVTVEEWQVLTSCALFGDSALDVSLVVDDGDGLATCPKCCVECVQEAQMQAEQAKYVYNSGRVFVQILNSLDDVSKTAVPTGALRSGVAGRLRRTTRTTGPRDSHDLSVWSTMTLCELKVQVMGLSGAAPNDQHLFCDGRELDGDLDATLGHLRIADGAVLQMVADETTDDEESAEAAAAAETRAPEAGFGRTLLGRGARPVPAGGAD